MILDGVPSEQVQYDPMFVQSSTHFFMSYFITCYVDMNLV